MTDNQITDPATIKLVLAIGFFACFLAFLFFCLLWFIFLKVKEKGCEVSKQFFNNQLHNWMGVTMSDNIFKTLLILLGFMLIVITYTKPNTQVGRYVRESGRLVDTTTGATYEADGPTVPYSWILVVKPIVTTK